MLESNANCQGRFPNSAMWMTPISEAKHRNLLLFGRVGERQVCCPCNSHSGDEWLYHLLEGFLAMIRQMDLQSEIEWERHGS